jgi:predicted nucleotidyltransferase
MTLMLSERHLSTLYGLLKRHASDCEVWAYGSRVRGDGDEASDIDIVLRNANNPDVSTGVKSNLTEAIRESTFPFVVDISEWADLPEWLRRSILTQHEILTPS